MRTIRILLVEDQNPELFRDILLHLKLSNGLDFTIATDGNQALLHVMKTPFDIIVIDLRIPFLSGIEVIRQVRLLVGPNQHIPIVAISAYTDRTTRQKTIEAGANGFFSKPLDYQAFALYILQLALTYLKPEIREQKKEELSISMRRLNFLRVQKTQEGHQVRASVLIEIEDLEQEIEDLEREVNELGVD